ncbi:kunitz-type protease inhibitor 2 isoform X2 [Anolis carolinensis]|uniref:kunitz-type protease inhibitor 2 isoform X2 n=1 Tax=Anolis carolinensis TaxID=28377 RepID=UPI002F2B269E
MRAARESGGVLSWALVALLILLAGAESVPENCHLPKVVGRCRASFPRWWYNATSQTCQRFIFGGCRGNSNNFLSEEECKKGCATDGDIEAPVTHDGPAEEIMTSTTKAISRSGRRHEPGDDRVGFEEFCAAPKEVGHCRASFPRWYFDTETRTCKMFIYGGCGGNKNNYIFEEHCLNQCSGNGAVVLAILLAVMAAILLGSMVFFFIKLCRRNQDGTLERVWSTMDDKESLMNNAYTL